MPSHDRSGLMCWTGRPEVMRRAHRHDDIEVNVALGGDLDYVVGGRVISLDAGSTVIFWAAIPHQLVAAAPDASIHWLTVPLGTVLGFGLPQQSLTTLLHGEPVLLEGTDPQGLPHAWVEDLDGDVPQLRAAALLEVQAWLRRRLWHGRCTRDAGGLPAAAVGASLPRDTEVAGRMARDIAVNFRDPLTVEHVAKRAALSPGHAMTVFRRVVGSTIGSYLAQCRIAEAQRLLITTDATVTDVALQSGFASQSAFYASFTSWCQEPPGAYRTRVRGDVRR